MSIRRALSIVVLAASSALAQTAPPVDTQAPARTEPAPRPAETPPVSDAPRPLPEETTVDAPARSREQAAPRLPDVLRTVPGITPR
jgi:hypothetical protein